MVDHLFGTVILRSLELCLTDLAVLQCNGAHDFLAILCWLKVVPYPTGFGALGRGEGFG